MKYPKTITDEATGQEVPNELYKAYQEGIREVVEWVERYTIISNEIFGEESHISFRFIEGEWQAKLKEWGIDGD